MTSETFFKLPDPSYEQYTWILRDEHGPSSVPPLLIRNRFNSPGLPGEPPRALNLHGFNYLRANSGPEFRPPWSDAPPPRTVADLRLWREQWLPEVEKIVLELESFDPSRVEPGHWAETLQAQEEFYTRVFGGIHSLAPGPAHAASGAFMEAFEARFGPERREDMHALLQGMPNCSVDRAGALWDLSRILRANPELLEALNRRAELPDTAAGKEFKDGLAAMLAIYGHTSNTDLQDLPAWREDPDIPLAATRAFAGQPDGSGPREAAARQRDRRLELEGELRGLAPGDPAVAEILRLMEMAQELVPNLEDHNFLADQRMLTASRARWLAIGRLLKSRGLIDASDDVFFIEAGELLDVLEGNQVPEMAVLTDRRRDLRQGRAASPPPILGRPLEQSAESAPETPAGSSLSMSESRVVRGIAASPGSFVGRSRVIETLEEAATLVEGDVLVVRTTTPPWTPFFALASAIVTNSGGVLSHAAVVAREFGVPAVVGTINGTALIKDGATITVDGSVGLVIVEE